MTYLMRRFRFSTLELDPTHRCRAALPQSLQTLAMKQGVWKSVILMFPIDPEQSIYPKKLFRAFVEPPIDRYGLWVQ